MANTHDSNKNKKNWKKRWLGIIVAVIFLIGGFFVYYFHFYSFESRALNAEFEKGFDILIVGYDKVIDSSKSNTQKEADAIAVLSFNPKERKIVLRSIPSDLFYKNKPLKDYEIEKLLKNIEYIIGFKPEYYFTINYKGFKKVVNELSGIKVNLNNSLEIPALGIYFEKGDNLLSGKEALNYVRWKGDRETDTDRIYRQYHIIQGVLDKILQPNTLLNISKLYSTLVTTFEAVNTNMDKDLINGISKFLKNRSYVKIEHKIINSIDDLN